MGIWVGRYSMVAGEVHEHGPWLAEQICELAEGSVRLIVLAEPADQRSAEFCGEVANAVAELFAREALSVTGGLLRALRQAHHNLAEWNSRSLREHRVSIGVTCVAIRSGEATVAQVGPGVVYLVSAGTAQRITTADYAATMVPLGGNDAIEPRFTTTPLGDRHLLLLSSGAEEAIGQTSVLLALRVGPERALAELFGRTREIPDLTAVLIADLEMVADTPLPVGPSPFDEGREVMGAPVDSGLPLQSVSRPVGGDRGSQRPPPLPLPKIRRVPTVGPPRPKRPLVPRWSRVVIAVLLVMMVGAAAAVSLPGWLERDRADRVEQSLAVARDQIAIAEQESVERAREALTAARVELVEARAIDSQNTEAAALDRRVTALLAELDAIVVVDDLRLQRFAGLVPAPLSPTQLEFGDGSLWFVDSEQGRVLRMDAGLSFGPDEVYRDGGTYSGQVAGKPVSMTWDELNSRMLLIDEQRQLWAFADAPLPVRLPLRDVEQLASVTDISSYLGSLYILDAVGEVVWRYLPAGIGYDSEREGLLPAADLSDASALTVDGEVFVLEGGRVRRFSQGDDLGDLLVGIDTPPVAASGLAEDTGRGLIYIADRGNARIVVAQRSGGFLRQFRHPDFDDLRGIALSEDGTTLFLLSSGEMRSFEAIPDPA